MRDNIKLSLFKRALLFRYEGVRFRMSQELTNRRAFIMQNRSLTQQ